MAASIDTWSGSCPGRVDRVTEVAVAEVADGLAESPPAHHLMGDQFARGVSEVMERELGYEVMLLGILRHGATVVR
ncbi:hypothetical protein ACIQOF_16270 [Streptomyces sp. NPDC091265]|uniref:hypothetical protein n=1 Tax=unclassified Streptomyces TaxID=2593676 RepID=UPI00344D6F28